MTQFARLIDSAPVVPNAAARVALIPNPLINQMSFNQATGNYEQWNGSQWLTVISSGLTGPIIDVTKYGAIGDGANDDGPAIRRAITAAQAISGFLSGGIVFFPPGKYRYTGTLQVPVALNSGQVSFKGSGMRVTYLFPAGASTSFSPTGTQGVPACLVFGALVPDASGTTTNVTQYHGWEDISISGSLITSGSVRAVVVTQMQNGWGRRSIIESFPNASWGLYLRGATVTGGLGAAVTAPHVRLCHFSNLVISTIGSNNSAGARACVLQNADENSFDEGCVFGVTAGQTVAANSLIAFELQLGRNNRLGRTLCSGDTTALKSGYVGMAFGPPVNEDGVANGSVIGNVVEPNAVAEGFSVCWWVKADASGNTLGNVVRGWPSIYTTDYIDDTQPTNPGGFTLGGQGGNAFFAPALGRMYQAVREACAPTAVLANNSATPSVSGSNTWTAADSTPGIITTDFLNGADGQRLLIRFTNGNRTIRDVNNGGGGNIRNYGRQDIVGAANWVVLYQKISGIWHQISPVRFEGGSGNVTGAALGTTAVRGFTYMPTCAGPPTGVPAELPTGAVPFVYDTTNHKLWVYDGAAWKGVVLA